MLLFLIFMYFLSRLNLKTSGPFFIYSTQNLHAVGPGLRPTHFNYHQLKCTLSPQPTFFINTVARPKILDNFEEILVLTATDSSGSCHPEKSISHCEPRPPIDADANYSGIPASRTHMINTKVVFASGVTLTVILKLVCNVLSLVLLQLQFCGSLSCEVSPD